MERVIKLILNVLPKVLISDLTGLLARTPIPRALRPLVLGIFTRVNKINLAEVALPITEFSSVARFFVRELKLGLRPIGDGFVSPVDGTLRSCGEIRGDMLENIKGSSYHVGDLLNRSNFQGRSFLNFYLAPKDYHHIHAPLDLRVINWRYIPGTLWPVNDWAARNVSDLFARNSRVVIEAESEIGRIFVVLVGAFNVGRIELAIAGHSAVLAGRHPRQSSFKEPIEVKKGDRLGMFHLGSTVVVITQEKIVGLMDSLSHRSVKMGESLLGSN